MATFNGSKFISEQLESLAAQKFLPWELVICDDGSTDNTLELIDSFSKFAPFPVRVFRNESTLGFAENFLKAARLCSGDWISFCDQDDFWLPNKLEDVQAAIKKDKRPIIILQYAFLCDADLSHQKKLFPDRLDAGYYPPRSQFGFWVWPGLLQTVHASIFDFRDDRTLPRSYFPGHDLMPHDKWTCMIGNATCGIRVLSGAAALYRRHEEALTGSYAGQSVTRRISKALPVGSVHYKFLSEVADETAEYLQTLARLSTDKNAENFSTASCSFFHLGRILYTRARLYEADSIIKRVSTFLTMIRIRGYFGSSMTALGGKSMLKDTLVLFGILGPSRRKKI
tara:strand:- start:19090 stop:20109 length:1020 start_codon:yes stop_codon:yes gene_type:complete